MRARTTAAAGAGAAVTVAVTALLTSGVLTTPVPGLGASPAAAAELVAFGDCEQLREWYVEAALPQVGPYGFPQGRVYLAGEMPTATEDMVQREGATPSDAVGSGPTGTNVQEAGVDEPDLAKTDGSLVAHVRGRQLVLTDVGGPSPRQAGRIRLPASVADAELLWVGDRLVLVKQGGGWGGPGPVDLGRPIMPEPPGQGLTEAVVVDVSTPASPRIEDRTVFGGRLLSARQYDGVVRLVVSTEEPTIDFVTPNRSRTEDEATRENRARVRNSRIEDWLPTVTTGGTTSVLLECADVQHPRKSAGFGTVSIVTFDPEEPGGRRTTGVTASSDLVYSSTDRLYLGTSPGIAWEVPLPMDDTLQDTSPRKPVPQRTEVHAFALDGLATDYVASGEVPGRIRDRWSMSEHDGHLRVATALGQDAWAPRENAVVVLKEDGEALVETGRVEQMGIREQIQSVRWFDDLAIVVTFRQVDPLYTVDLSDPAAPRVAGELKIPGFSAYLHPVGDDLLLGLGQDADRRGTPRGAQAASFDVGDLAAPERLATTGFGAGTSFVAAWEPRGFTYLPQQRLALTTLQDSRRGVSRLVVLEVGADGTLTQRSARPVAGWDASTVRTLPLSDGRVALVAADEVGLVDLGS